MAVLSLNALPLGYRFRPTDEELVDYYLRLKINGNDKDVRVIREIDVCKWEPWDLPDLSVIRSTDQEWFFFCPLDRKYPNGHRSNRATGAGYWKATGKDRKIKSSVRGMSLIGMKKTLVFYKGRAPKGMRTNWVIHEYRATTKDLDGTNPGQSAFVLCRLFKKQDENAEGSNCDEVEPAVSSPTINNSSPEVMQSEPALVQSPVLGRQSEEQPISIDSFPAENSDITTPGTLAPVECHSSGYDANDAEDQVVEANVTEVDLELEEDMKFLYDPMLEAPDCKLFSPLHSQMHVELGSSYSYCSVTNGFCNNHNGVQLQYGTNEPDDIAQFLDSILNNSDENSCEESGSQRNSAVDCETPKYVNLISKDSESCSESDAEVAQAQFDREVEASGFSEVRAHGTLTSANNNDEHRENMGFIRNDSLRRDAFSVGSDVDQVYNLFCLEASSSHANGNIVGTGIRIRTRQPQNQPSTQNFVAQGTAARRLRLQKKLEGGPFYCRAEDHEEKSTVIEAGKATEKHTTGTAAATMDEPQEISRFNNDRKVDQELSLNMKRNLRLKSDVPTGSDEKVPSVFSKAPPASHTISSSVYLLRVLVVIVLFIIFVGICRCLKF